MVCKSSENRVNGLCENENPSQAAPSLIGSRIRERRLARGLAQAALAQAVGISPSYLNLIEHNHRRIGGKLLLAIATALEVDAGLLTEGAQAGRAELLRAAARLPEAEADRIDELTARFPGWTQAIVSQEGRLSDLEVQIEALRDRLTHDTALSEAMHEVLSSVAAIRSTADILVRETDLNPAWRGRFHRNLHEEAERLSDRAADLTATFELPDGRISDAARHAVEPVEAFFDLADHHFPTLEQDGVAAIGPLIDGAVGLDTVEARNLARLWLEIYAADAAALPLTAFQAAAEAADYDPAVLLARAPGDAARVLRRLANLPPRPGTAPFGLARVDGTGALLYRKRFPGFTLPRHGHGCPRWPIFRAASRPGQPDSALLSQSGGVQLRAWSVADVEESLGLGHAPLLVSTMLVRAAPDEDGPALEVGPDCPTCRNRPDLVRH